MYRLVVEGVRERERCLPCDSVSSWIADFLFLRHLSKTVTITLTNPYRLLHLLQLCSIHDGDCCFPLADAELLVEPFYKNRGILRNEPVDLDLRSTTGNQSPNERGNRSGGESVKGSRYDGASKRWEELGMHAIYCRAKRDSSYSNVDPELTCRH